MTATEPDCFKTSSAASGPTRKRKQKGEVVGKKSNREKTKQNKTKIRTSIIKRNSAVIHAEASLLSNNPFRTIDRVQTNFVELQGTKRREKQQ
jgi:hypothetical protein